MMPFYKAAELLGDRWTLLIARQFLIEGSISYTELLRRIPGIATNILSSRLEKLVSHGVIEVATDEADKRRRVYSPSRKVASLVPVIRAIELWAKKKRPTLGHHVRSSFS